MHINAKVQELLDLLSERGLKAEAIEHVRDGLWAQANETFMDEVLSSLTDEDLEQVEASANQDEANQKFAAIYLQKTGKDMQTEMNRIVEQYTIDLLKKYSLNEASEPMVSYSTDSTDGDTNVDNKEVDSKIHDLT